MTTQTWIRTVTTEPWTCRTCGTAMATGDLQHAVEGTPQPEAYPICGSCFERELREAMSPTYGIVDVWPTGEELKRQVLNPPPKLWVNPILFRKFYPVPRTWLVCDLSDVVEQERLRHEILFRQFEPPSSLTPPGVRFELRDVGYYECREPERSDEMTANQARDEEGRRFGAMVAEKLEPLLAPCECGGKRVVVHWTITYAMAGEPEAYILSECESCRQTRTGSYFGAAAEIIMREHRLRDAAGVSE